MIELEHCSMGRRGKAIIMVLGLVAGLGVAVAAAAVTFQMKERELRLAKEKELLLIKAEKDDLEQRLSEVIANEEQMRARLLKAEAQLEQTAKALAQELQVKDALAKSIDERQREIDRLGRDLQQMRSERATLVEEVSHLKEEQQQLERQFAEAQQDKEELEAQMRQQLAQPSLELDKVVVTKLGPAPASIAVRGTASNASVAEGQVVVVNREYDFIVMNLGRNQGLQVGQELEILREGQLMGRAKVEKVYEELAAAALLSESDADAIREGDLVRAL